MPTRFKTEEAIVVLKKGTLLLAAVFVLSVSLAALGQVKNLNRIFDHSLGLPSPCDGIGGPFCWIRLLDGGGSSANGSLTRTTNYYRGLGFSTAHPDTLPDFKLRNKFDAGGDVQGVYFNEGDLRLGRDMHCKQSGAKV